MADNEPTALPAYLSFATFRSAIQNLRSHGLPPHLDTTAWGSRSGADRGQIWGAFQFFGLVDNKGNVQPLLKKLVDYSENSAEEKAILGDLLAMAYPSVFAEVDLKTATPKQLDDAIGSLGVTGSTRKRAVRFFIKAAQYSGTSLSPRLTANLRERGGASEEAAPGPDTQPATAIKGNGKTRRRRQPSPPAPSVTTDKANAANAMKTIHLPDVDGTLTISGTFNPFKLMGAERELVYKIIDLMSEYDQKTTASE